MATSHDQTARRVFGVTHETIVRRILATFDRATPSDVEAGARWYDEANQLAQSLAGDPAWLESTLTANHVAVIIAHLSPRTSWSRNVAGTVEFVRSGECYPGIMGSLYERALASLEFENPFDSFGPSAAKTRSFARNIAGDREAVTVDVWAARVADLDETLLGRVGAYDAVAHAYRLAARRRGVDPATMQATTWVVARNGRAA